MINTEDFIKRLENILEYYNLNASAFADKISVQRSSLSHLLSGRNKPSLDFILKILEVFPEVDLYWILYGKGTFPKSLETHQLIQNPTTPSSSVKSDVTLFSTISPNKETTLAETEKIEKTILEKIVFFYTDGSFKEYKSN